MQAAVLVAFLVGSIQLAISFLRLGDLTRYISHSVIVGFTAGASVLLVLDQMKNLLGLKAVGDVHDHFLVRFWHTMTEGGTMQPTTFAIGLASIGLVLALRVVKARLDWKLLPEFLIVVIVMAVVTAAFDLASQGVTVVGDIPASLPAFAPAASRRAAAPRSRRERARDRAPRPARGDRDGQGDRRGDRAAARPEPAVPERRPRQLHRQLLPMHAGLGLADALGDQPAGGGPHAMVGRGVGASPWR